MHITALAVVLFLFSLFSGKADARRPVLVLPGIGASYADDLFCGQEGAIQDFERDLRSTKVFTRWFTSINTEIPLEWSVDSILHSYDSLIAEINKNPELVAVPVPWDWRLSLVEASKTFLEPAIRKAKQDYGAREVDLVAHSAGGLLARYYLQRRYRGDVGKVAFLGTPHRGSADAYLLWAGGEASGGVIPWYDRAIKGGVGTSATVTLLYELLLENMKEGCDCPLLTSDFEFVRFGCEGSVTAGFPGFRDLLPIYPYVFTRKVKEPTPLEQMCLLNRNPFLESINATADELVATGVKMTNFASGAIRTLRKIHTMPLSLTTCGEMWGDGEPVGFEKPSRAGDGRVLLESACPEDSIPAFAAVPCVTKDGTFSEKRPRKRVSHGELPTVFREEVVAFLKEPVAPHGPTFVQLTKSAGKVPTWCPIYLREAKISGDGGVVAFSSCVDYTGLGSDRSQGNRPFFVFASGSGLKELPGVSYGGCSFLFGGASAGGPSVSDDGTLLAYDYNSCTNDPLASSVVVVSPDFDDVFEPFGRRTVSPSLSGDGSSIAFIERPSSRFGPPVHKVWIAEDPVFTSQRKLLEVTTSSFDLFELSGDGSRLLYSYHGSGGLHLLTTDGAADYGITTISVSASLDDAGTRVIFHGDLDLTGENPDGSVEVFLWEEGGGIRQLTNRPAFSSVPRDTSFLPAISGNGRYAAFTDNCDVSDPGNCEVVRLDIDSGTMIPVTETTNGAYNGYPALNYDGSRIVFRSNADLTGGNPEHVNELFVATIPDPLP